MIKGQKLIQTSTTSFISKLQKENTKERRNKTKNIVNPKFN